MRRAVAWTNLDESAPEEESRGSIPSEISTWVRAFPATCGYEFPVPMGGGGVKCPCPANTGTRPATTSLSSDNI